MPAKRFTLLVRSLITPVAPLCLVVSVAWRHPEDEVDFGHAMSFSHVRQRRNGVGLHQRQGRVSQGAAPEVAGQPFPGRLTRTDASRRVASLVRDSTTNLLALSLAVHADFVLQGGSTFTRTYVGKSATRRGRIGEPTSTQKRHSMRAPVLFSKRCPRRVPPAGPTHDHRCTWLFELVRSCHRSPPS